MRGDVTDSGIMRVLSKICDRKPSVIILLDRP